MSAWYRLGENDPGAASGLAVTNTTTDLVGTNHLKQYNSPRYTNGVFSGPPDGLVSSLAMTFNGVDQIFSNSLASLNTDDFGIEAWVKPNNTTNFFMNAIAYNGSLSSGWGFFGN